MAFRWCVLLLSIPLVAAAQNSSGLLPDACGPDMPRKQAITPSAQATNTQPAPGKALLVFVETMETAGSVPLNANVRVGIDGKWIGVTRGRSWFSTSVDPGTRHLCADWPSRHGLDLTRIYANSVAAQAGEVYYFRIAVVSRNFNQGVHTMLAEPYQEQSMTLTPLNRDEAKYLLQFAPPAAP